VTYIIGEALAELQKLPSESVHCIVTSPPYWNLRDYKVKGQLGREPTPEEYVTRLVAILAEARRVLRSDGTVGAVCEALGRRWVGIELNPEYEPLIRRRTAQRGLFT
jgi:DNA modification methylase